MRKLHELAKELKKNNFKMTQDVVNQFEEFLSIISEGSRILHPKFGLGTVKGTQGNTWVTVEFDNDNKKWQEEEKERLKEIEILTNENKHIPWNLKYPSNKTERNVYITSCYSIHMLLKNENRETL